MNNASQTCENESGLLKVLSKDDKKNKKLIVQRIYTIVKMKVMFLQEIT